MKKINFISVVFLCLMTPVAAGAFNLSVSVSGGSGSWSDGVYEITGAQNLDFTCTPSNGTPTYSYVWNFETLESYIDYYDSGPTYTDDQNPSSVPFNRPGKYIVEVAVTDSAGSPVTEKAYLVIEMIAVRSPYKYAYVATPDGCGLTTANEQNGTTDVTTKLQTCVDTLTTGGVIDFGNYTYLLEGAKLGAGTDYGAENSNVGLKIAYENIALVGAEATINFDHANDEDTVTDYALSYRYDSSITDGFYVTGITFNYDQDTGNAWNTIDDQELVRTYPGTTISFMRNSVNHFRLFGQTSNPIQNYNNFDNWGWGGMNLNRCSTGGNCLYYRNWSDVFADDAVTDGGDDFNYTNPANSNNYNVENYIDNTGMKDSPAKPCLRMYGSGTANMHDHYFIGNYLKGCELAGIEIRCNDCDATYTLTDILIKGNIFSDWSGHGIYMEGDSTVAANTTADILENEFYISSSTDQAIQRGSDGARLFGSNVDVSDNIFGEGVNGTDPNDFADSDLFTWIDEPTQNQGVAGSGNVDNSDSDPVSVAVAFEFVPPTNNGDTATDAGSGMGATARFPFQEGALAQGSDLNNNFSQIELYADRANLNGWDKVRYADVDHNWSELDFWLVGVEIKSGSLSISSGSFSVK